MSNKKLIAATLAATAAVAFSAAPVTSALAQGDNAQVKCYGTNTCKGHSECKTATSECKGQNACKGQGHTMESSGDACTKAGGKTEA